MLIERYVEDKIKEELASQINKCEIVGSWAPANVGQVKGEHDKSAKATISIYIQPREHDSFSLPTVNVNGSIAIEARAEMCPTMAEVSEIYETVLGILDGWHYDANGFSEYMSSSDFYATEIKLNGGDKVTYDRNSQSWIVLMNFTIRGVVNHD